MCRTTAMRTSLPLRLHNSGNAAVCIRCWACQGTSVDDPEQDREAGPVRNHRDDAAVSRALDPRPRNDRPGVPLAQPNPWQSASVDATVCPDRPGMGCIGRTGA